MQEGLNHSDIKSGKVKRSFWLIRVISEIVDSGISVHRERMSSSVVASNFFFWLVETDNI